MWVFFYVGTFYLQKSNCVGTFGNGKQKKDNDEDWF